MASGDPQRTWLPEMLDVLRETLARTCTSRAGSAWPASLTACILLTSIPVALR